jgi:hypothetical protein
MQAPSYAAFEGSDPYRSAAEFSMPNEAISGGYMKRYYTVSNNDNEQQDMQQQQPDTKTESDSNLKAKQ